MQCKKVFRLKFNGKELIGFKTIRNRLTDIMKLIQNELDLINPEKFDILELLSKQHKYYTTISKFKEFDKILRLIVECREVQTSDEFNIDLTENELTILDACFKIFYNKFMDWFNVDELINLSKMVCG